MMLRKEGVKETMQDQPKLHFYLSEASLKLVYLASRLQIKFVWMSLMQAPH